MAAPGVLGVDQAPGRGPARSDSIVRSRPCLGLPGGDAVQRRHAGHCIRGGGGDGDAGVRPCTPWRPVCGSLLDHGRRLIVTGADRPRTGWQGKSVVAAAGRAGPPRVGGVGTVMASHPPVGGEVRKTHRRLVDGALRRRRQGDSRRGSPIHASAQSALCRTESERLSARNGGLRPATGDRDLQRGTLACTPGRGGHGGPQPATGDFDLHGTGDFDLQRGTLTCATRGTLTRKMRLGTAIRRLARVGSPA